MDDQQLINADRISQLESNLLDKELSKILDESIDNLKVPKWADELKLATKFFIATMLLRDHTTVGRKVYSIKYANTEHCRNSNSLLDSRFLEPKNYKMQIMILIDIVVPYVFHKIHISPAVTNFEFIKKLKLPWLTLENIELLFKLFSALNFLMFLRRGTQLRLVERILGLSPLMPRDKLFDNTIMNRYQVEINFRETLWRAMTEFITLVIPLINIVQLKNRAISLLWLKKNYVTKGKLSDLVLKANVNASCGICNNQPFNPYIIGCKHVFCYYCLYSRYLSDTKEGFVCTLCNYCARDENMVSRYKSFGST